MARPDLGANFCGCFKDRLESFPFVIILSCPRMTNLKLFENVFIGSEITSSVCFSKTTDVPSLSPDVFPPWHCAKTQLSAPDERPAKPSAFIEVLTVAHDQLFNPFD